MCFPFVRLQHKTRPLRRNQFQTNKRNSKILLRGRLLIFSMQISPHSIFLPRGTTVWLEKKHPLLNHLKSSLVCLQPFMYVPLHFTFPHLKSYVVSLPSFTCGSMFLTILTRSCFIPQLLAIQGTFF